ncbi:HYR domain-containing protein, partial [Gaetbulibacter aquiaggeris]
MKTITLKTNLQRYLVLILFMCLGFSNLYSQDNSCITLANCPSDIAVCADTYAIPGDTSSPYGANVIWNTPDVSQTCSNNSTGGNFNMLFELNEQLLSQDCWNFNYISRVGTGGGYVKLFSGNDRDKDEKSKILTPYLILEDDTNVTIDLVYDQGNYNVQLFLDGGIDNLGNPYPNKALNTYTVTGAQSTYSWAVNFDPGNGAVTGITGIYKLRFVFTYIGDKPTNANTGDTIIAIEGFLNEDGCKAGIDFTVTGPNQGFYPVGVHNLQYIATYTAPDGSVITKSCSFTITVVGLEVTATGTDVSCSGETDGQIRVQGSGAINDGNSASTYKLFDSNDVKIGEFSYPLTTNPNTVYTFTPENTNNPIGAGTYTIEFDQVINGGATCQATTTVTIGTDPDTTPPVFSSCPTDISVNNDTGECGALVTWTQPIAGDNCEIASLTSNFNSGDTFPVGTTTVTYTATDGVGLTTYCSFDVIVTDNEAPTITCPDDIVVSNDADSCDAVVNYTTPVGTDNCPDANTVLTAGLASGSAFPIGTTLVTYQVTDAAGRTAQCSFNVIVNDTQDPIITCPGDVTANTSDDGEGNCSTTVLLGSPVANDNCVIKSIVAQVGGVDIDPTTFEFDLGETLVTWIVTDDSDRTASCDQTVTIIDDESPRFDAPPTVTITCNDDPDDLTLTGTVTRYNIDNCDSTPLDPVYSDSTAPGTCPIITVITRTWTIYDLTGNFHTHTQTINVVPDTLVISDVPNETVTAGTYSTQEDLDTAFAAWLNNFSVSGGCSPSGDFAEQYTAPALCGGSVDVVYNVTDLCQTGQDTATFTVTPADALVISDVQDLTVNA